MVQAHKGKVLPVVLPVILGLPGFCCTLLRYPLWRLFSYAFLLPWNVLYSLCPRMAFFACILRKLKYCGIISGMIYGYFWHHLQPILSGQLLAVMVS